jgi:hypothetical protein
MMGMDWLAVYLSKLNPIFYKNYKKNSFVIDGGIDSRLLLITSTGTITSSSTRTTTSTSNRMILLRLGVLALVRQQ